MAIIDVLETIFLPSILNLPNTNMQIPGAIELPLEEETQWKDDDKNEDELQSFSDALLQAVDDDLTKNIQDEAKLIVAINSAFTSAEHIDQLELLIRECSSDIFPTDAMVLDCVPKSINEISRDFRAVVDNGIDALLARTLAQDAKRLIHSKMELVNYELSSTEYDRFEVHGSMATRVIETLLHHPVLIRCKRLLSSVTFDMFMKQFTKIITTQFEECIRTKAFNEWGAMQLEREVRLMLTKLSSIVSESSLRSQFARLDQLVLLLNVMRPSDLAEYDTIQDHLSLAEIEASLRLRSGFRRDSMCHSFCA